jgi:hypothetical protein
MSRGTVERLTHARISIWQLQGRCRAGSAAARADSVALSSACGRSSGLPPNLPPPSINLPHPQPPASPQPATAAMAGATESSMRPYMRLQNLFVREIDTSLARETVITELQTYCPPSQGKVVVPVSDSTGGILGIAYLNYLNHSDGEGGKGS